MTKDQIIQARKMRDQGLTYKAIGDALGKSTTAIAIALDPEVREKNKRACAKWKRTHKKESSRYQAEYYKAHREKKSAYVAEWHKKHENYQAEYGRSHRAEGRARAAAWEARKKNATVGDRDAIKEIYRKAREDRKVRCYLCGRLIPMGQRHVDHIIPLSKGGPHCATNLAVACATCNRKKHNKLPEELGILL